MGATLSVTFGSGLKITNIASASDTSIITIHFLPADTNPEAVRGLLARFEPSISADTIRVSPIEDWIYATAKLESHDRAIEIVKRLDSFSYQGNVLSVKHFQPKGVSNSSQSATRVSCTWFSPSKIAAITFRDHRTAMKEAAAGRGKWVRGRKIECQLKSTASQRSTGAITVGGLAADTTTAELKRVFRNGVDNIDFRAVNYDLPPKEAVVWITSLVEQKHGEIEGYDLVTKPDALKSKAVIRFTSEAAAINAIGKYNGKPRDFLGNNPLYLQPIFTANFKIAAEIYRVVKPELDTLAKEQDKSIRIKIFGLINNATSGPSNAIVTVRVTGSDKAEVSTVKTLIGRIVRGDLVRTKNGQVLWDSYYARAEGILEITKIGKETRTFIFCDRRKSQLYLFGADENRKDAEIRLCASMASLAARGNDLPLTSTSLKYVMRGGLKLLQQKFGADTVQVNLVKRCITIKGTNAVLQDAKMLLESMAPKKSTASMSDCPICFDKPDKPTRFGVCNHVYCLSCLKDYIASTLDTRKFPIACIGENGNSSCTQTLSLPAITSILPAKDLDSIFTAAFLDHIRRNPNKFSYCPTPNCSTVYQRSSTPGEVFTCPDCLLDVCKSCNVETHDGVSCTEFKIANHSDENADRLFSEWKRRHGVQKCPNCSVDIQKVSGCNHVTCKSCMAHMCWVCLRKFEAAGEVYTHMNLVHGGDGL